MIRKQGMTWMRLGNWKLGVVAAVAAVALAASSASAADAPAGVGGPPWARGGQGPRPFMLFQIFDADEDGALTEDEVPAPVWSRLSAADLDGDGAVTREEIMAHLQKSGGGRPGRQSRPQAEQPKK
ncbi:hypothetical protein LBMAG52_08970 [Planctomycetia bacterium]|nr:hypothetical protein LBMAG52_08970 [Planctomycetia bacterium]